MKQISSQTEFMRLPAIHIVEMRPKIMKTLSVISFLFLLAGAIEGNAIGQAPSAQQCTNSTVADAWGTEFELEAQRFFLTLQHAVRNNDAQEFAKFVQYPLHVYGSERGEIKNPSEMIQKYSSIITPVARQAILTQSPSCLFGNGQGVMAAGGRIWFQRQKDGKMKVITLNIVQP